ncbi:MAG TPA: HEAT repeat domain-containing protein [Planctomycetota bacterium]|nr:HEAT repeat domain-containing protein [Planctomycetota bacterium]
MSNTHESGSRSGRTLLLLILAGFLWVSGSIVILAWWLLPRLAPTFVVTHAPFPSLVFRAAIEGKASTVWVSERLTTMKANVAPAMIGQLHHSDDKARSLALTVLGALKDPQATEPIIALLTDPRENLQALAIDSLGRIGDLRSLPHLIPYLNHPVYGGPTVLALRRFPDVPVADAMEPLQQRRWHPNVLSVLTWNEDPRVPQWLDAAMRSADPAATDHAWQETAAATLAVNPSAPCRPLMLAAMRDADPRIRQFATRGLMLGLKLQPHQLRLHYRDPLLTLLADPDPDVIKEAALVCDTHNLVEAIPPLIALLNDADPHRRSAATWGFGVELADSAATARLIDLRADDDPLVHAGAVAALKRLIARPRGLDQKARASLIAKLRDDSAIVRRDAAVNLTLSSQPEVTDSLIGALADADPTVVAAALTALSLPMRPFTDTQQAQFETAIAARDARTR